MSLRLAALTALVTLAALVLGGPTVSAQAPTEETLLSSLSNTTNSSGNCESYAAGFTTGSAAATLTEVQLATSSSGVDLEIRENSGGNPGASVLYQMTYASTSGGVSTFTAPDNAALSASTTYWLVVPNGSPGTCDVLTSGPTYSTLHGWSGGGLRYWSTTQSQWNSNPQALRFAIMGTIHSGPAHDPQQPERPDYQQDYEPLPECTEEQRQWRQRGRELPPACAGGFSHPFQVYPSSDPCDQPWQVRGSYRHDRGCLSRY